MKGTLAPALIAALLAVAPAEAQSLFSAAGLGMPSEPVDARARALGNAGIGLWGSSLLPHDPGAAGMLRTPTALIVGQPSWVDFARDDEAGSFRGNRFPLMGIAYPAAAQGMLTVTFASLLDQRYRAERQVTFELEDGPAKATDVFVQDGGVSQVGVGFSRPFGDNVAAGLTVARYAGSVDRRLERTFDTLNAPGTVQQYLVGGSWSYSGYGVTGGVAADLGTVARVAASLTWSTDLDAEATENTAGRDRSYPMPVQLRVGATGVLAPGLMATASLVRADWSDAAAEVANAGAVGSAHSFGFGVELSRARLLGREAPLRFGYARRDLPFSLGTDQARETVWSGGLGLSLIEGSGFALAGFDFALESGRREDGLLTEDFWRATLSLRVAGF